MDETMGAAGTGSAAGEAGRPLISVIMPVYNGERYLDEAIRSIREQTLREIELIVLDDGSTDGSWAIAARHAAADRRVRVIALARTGLAGALNAGIEAARAEWVARLDGDDIAVPERLERQYRFILDHPEAGAVGSYGWDIGERGGAPVGMNRNGPTTMEEYREQRERGLLSVLTPSLVFRRDIALELGGYRAAYSPGEDADFTNRIADEHPVLVMPEPLIHYRIHGGSETTNQLVDQMRNLRRAELNSLRRRAGEPEYTDAEIVRIVSSRPLRERVREACAWRSHGYYRRGGALLAAGRPSGLIWLGMSAVWYPPLPVRRLRHQRVMSAVRDKLAQRR